MTPLGNKAFENTVGKGEIAHNEQFLLFPVFSTHLDNFLLFSIKFEIVENTVGKGEIAHNEQFLLFPVLFTHLDNFLLFSSNLKLSSANSFSLEESKICRLAMG